MGWVAVMMGGEVAVVMTGGGAVTGGGLEVALMGAVAAMEVAAMGVGWKPWVRGEGWEVAVVGMGSAVVAMMDVQEETAAMGWEIQRLARKRQTIYKARFADRPSTHHMQRLLLME